MLAPQNLTISNSDSTVSLRLTCPMSPGENTFLAACAPQHSGVRRAPQLKLLGSCPPAVQGTAVITNLYGAAFSLPAENQRIFLSAHQMINGWAGPKALFTALVPAPSN